MHGFIRFSQNGFFFFHFAYLGENIYNIVVGHHIIIYLNKVSGVWAFAFLGLVRFASRTANAFSFQ